MRDAVRNVGRRRVAVQVSRTKVVDRRAVEGGVDRFRTTLLMAPMPARKIAVKPEGQRTWKWWDVVSTKELKLGWFCKADRDGGRVYEVMEEGDWREARVFTYQLAETPQ